MISHTKVWMHIVILSFILVVGIHLPKPVCAVIWCFGEYFVYSCRNNVSYCVVGSRRSVKFSGRCEWAADGFSQSFGAAAGCIERQQQPFRQPQSVPYRCLVPLYLSLCLILFSLSHHSLNTLSLSLPPFSLPQIYCFLHWCCQIRELGGHWVHFAKAVEFICPLSEPIHWE